MLLSAGPTGLLKWESNQRAICNLLKEKLFELHLKPFENMQKFQKPILKIVLNSVDFSIYTTNMIYKNKVYSWVRKQQ